MDVNSKEEIKTLLSEDPPSYWHPMEQQEEIHEDDNRQSAFDLPEHVNVS